jgi:hypothetical protein
MVRQSGREQKVAKPKTFSAVRYSAPFATLIFNTDKPLTLRREKKKKKIMKTNESDLAT